MRRTAACLILIAGAGLAIAAQPIANWVTFRSPEGRYSVLLPLSPALKAQESTAADGGKLVQYMAQVETGDAAYIIGYFDGAPGSTFSFDAARDGMMRAIKGTVQRESTVSLDGVTGRELFATARASNGIEHQVHAIYYYVQPRVYLVQLIVPTSQVASYADRDRAYFASFRITRTPF
jgi:hypothetical protein